jgi:hypothetical protein
MAINFPLRFSDIKQKEDLKSIAKMNNRSINSQILALIDTERSYLKAKKLLKSKK